MKALLATVLSVPTLLLAPAAHAAPLPFGGPGEACSAARTVINLARAQHPNASPEQLVEIALNTADTQGAGLTPSQKAMLRSYYLKAVNNGCS